MKTVLSRSDVGVRPARSAVDCGSLLPLCGGRSLLRAARSKFARPFAPHHGQQAAASTKRQQAAAVQGAARATVVATFPMGAAVRHTQ